MRAVPTSLQDKQIAVIRALLQEGMRLTLETRKDLRAIAVIQKRSDEKLERMTGSRPTTNGRSRGRRQ